MIHHVLVVGATGATGKHVVQMLLDRGQNVNVIVRSKERMIDLLHLNNSNNNDTTSSSSSSSLFDGRLKITEASILDLTDSQLQDETKNCDAIVNCLGHGGTIEGMFGEPKKLVTDTTKRLTQNMPQTCSKFILMGTTGVSHPDGITDDLRNSWTDRCLLWLLRNYLPPHIDNEEVVQYLYHHHHPTPTELAPKDQFEWTIIRPSVLIDGDDDVTKYDIDMKPRGTLLGGGKCTITRCNVAHFMVDVLLDEQKWNKYKFHMPCIYGKTSTDDDNKNDTPPTTKK